MMNKLSAFRLSNRGKNFLILALSLIIVFQVVNVSIHKPPVAKANIVAFIDSPNGREYITVGNVITDIMERDARNIFGFANGTTTAYKYMAVGNSSIDQTKTQLDSEASTSGFGRSTAITGVAWVTGGDWAYNITYTWYGTGDQQLNAISVHNSVTGMSNNNMGALASLGGTYTFHNKWNLTATYTLVFNFN